MYVRWTLLCLLVACGCSEEPPQMMQMMIGTAGGTVSLGDGTSVVIPAGALSADVAITITSTMVTTQGAVGPSYSFQPEGQTFTQSVNVTLPFSPEKLTAGMTVEVRTAPAGSTTFTPLVTQMVDSTHVKASTTHFST